VLAAALVSGELPLAYGAHVGTLIDEAPLSVVVAAVEAAAAQGGVPACNSFAAQGMEWLLSFVCGGFKSLIGL
jgi:hypothetical protein